MGTDPSGTASVGAVIEAALGPWSPTGRVPNPAEKGMPGSTWKVVLKDSVWRDPSWGRAALAAVWPNTPEEAGEWREAAMEKQAGSRSWEAQKCFFCPQPPVSVLSSSPTKTAPGKGTGGVGCGVISACSSHQ